MIVGNPKSPRIMGEAFLAYRKHGLSVQGLLSAYRASCERSTIIRDWFWTMALRDWAHIDYTLAIMTVGDLSRAALVEEKADA